MLLRFNFWFAFRSPAVVKREMGLLISFLERFCRELKKAIGYSYRHTKQHRIIEFYNIEQDRESHE
jgi:hypothetical protein